MKLSLFFALLFLLLSCTESVGQAALIEQGMIDPSLTDTEGLTASDYAKRAGAQESLALLKAL